MTLGVNRVKVELLPPIRITKEGIEYIPFEREHSAVSVNAKVVGVGMLSYSEVVREVVERNSWNLHLPYKKLERSEYVSELEYDSMTQGGSLVAKMINLLAPGTRVVLNNAALLDKSFYLPQDNTWIITLNDIHAFVADGHVYPAAGKVLLTDLCMVERSPFCVAEVYSDYDYGSHVVTSKTGLPRYLLTKFERGQKLLVPKKAAISLQETSLDDTIYVIDKSFIHAEF